MKKKSLSGILLYLLPSVLALVGGISSPLGRLGGAFAQNTITTNRLFTDSLQINKRLKLGNSIIVEGTTNSIYSDNTDMFIQSKSAFVFNTIINANNAGNVGIGTTTPTQKLEIHSGNALVRGVNNFLANNDVASLFLGDDNNYVRAINGYGIRMGVFGVTDLLNLSQTTGNVGVGLTAPQEKLHVEGSGRFGIGNNYMRIGYNTVNAILDNFGQGVMLINYYSGKDVHIGTGVTKSNLEVGGNIGVGATPDPNYRLSVCGNIRAKKIVVETNWCDYVFDKNYKLMSLAEIEEYILQNKHLPGFPRESDIESNGADIGLLLSKQMEKIEEMTLYILQLKKENQVLSERLNYIESALKTNSKY